MANQTKSLLEFIDKLPDVKKERHLYSRLVVKENPKYSSALADMKFQNMALKLLENSHARHLMHGAL